MKPSVRASSVEGLRSELKDLRRSVMELRRITGDVGGTEPIGAAEPEAPGGSIPFLVAAFDAPDAVKAVSDYLCDGTADEVQINAAIADAATASVNKPVVHLSEGTFSLSAPINYLIGLHGANPSGGSVNPGATRLKVDAAMTGPVIQADTLSNLTVSVIEAVTGTVVDTYHVMSEVALNVGTSTTGTAVTVYGTNARISDCEVLMAAGGTAFDVDTNGFVTLTGVHVSSASIGIACGAGRVAVAGCTFGSILTSGVTLLAGTVAAVAGCVFHNMPTGIDNSAAGDLNSGAAAANTFKTVTTPVA